MNLLRFITDIFKPAADLIDNVHTSDEERLVLKNKLAEIMAALETKVLEFQLKFAKLQASVIQSEATGESWLQRNWRPITMLNFLALINLSLFGFVNSLPDNIWTLLELGLGGYVIGRSVEKVSKTVAEVFKNAKGS